MLISRRFIAVGILSLLLMWPSGAGAIGLEPSLVRLSMRPGEIWRGVITLTNDSGDAVTALAGSMNVRLDDGGNVVDRSAGAIERIGTIASWIHPGTPKIRLAAGTSTEFNYSIQIPESASPGLHRGLMVFSVFPDTVQGNALAVTTAVAVGIELTVVGQPYHRIALGDVLLRPRIGAKPPVSVMTSVVNSGNTLPVVDVSATVRRLWGRGADVALTPDSGSAVVAPGSVSVWRGTWDGAGYVPAGLFRLTVVARDSSGAYEVSRWLLLVPWQAMVGLVVGLGIVVWGRRFWRLFGRRRKK